MESVKPEDARSTASPAGGAERPATPESQRPKGRPRHWLVSILVLLDAFLFYVFYTKFIPEGLASQITGVSAVFAGVLAIGGLREPGKILSEDFRWKPSAKVVVALVAVLLAVLIAAGWVWAPTVDAVVGSTILVDGKKYRVVTERDWSPAPGSIRRVALIVPWGKHEITVSRKGYVAMSGEVPEFTEEVRAPSVDAMPCNHAAFLHFKSQTGGDSSIPDQATDLDWKKATVQRDALLLALDHSFELPDTVPPGSIGSTEDHLPSLTLEIGVEQRPIDIKPYLTITTLNREGSLERRYPRILCGDAPQSLTDAAISIRNQLFGELGKASDPEDESEWRARIPHLLSASLAIEEARDALNQARQLMGKARSSTKNQEQEAWIKETQANVSLAYKRVSDVYQDKENPDPHLRILAGRVAVMLMDLLTASNVPSPDRLKSSGDTVAGLADLAKGAGQVGLARKALDTFNTLAQQAARPEVPEALKTTLSAQQTRVRESLKEIPALKLQKSDFVLPDEGQANKNGYIGDFGCTGHTATVLTVQNRAVGYVYTYDFSGGVDLGGGRTGVDSFSVLLSGISDTTWKDSPRVKSRVTFTAKDAVGVSRLIDVGRLRYKVTLRSATQDKIAGNKFVMETVKVAVHVDVVPEVFKD